MKYSPRFIIYWTVCRYLTDEEIKMLNSKLTKTKTMNDRMFIRRIEDVFDLERLLKNPLLQEDAWIYYYIKYDTVSKLPKKGRILKYENKVLKPTERAYKNFIAMFNPLG
jgi:hypothetical protein